MIGEKNSTRIVLAFLTALVTVTLWSPISIAHAQEDGTQSQALVLLTDSDAQQLAQVQDLVREQGGRTLHVFPHQAVIVRASSTTLEPLAALPGVAGVFTKAVDLSTADGYGSHARRVAGVWNSLVASQATPPGVGLATQEHQDGDQVHDDAFVAPDLPSDRRMSTSGVSIASSTPITPGYYQTSEYMAGSVAVGIVLVESDGSVDASTEDWTPEEKEQVFNEIVTALNWWAKLELRANLSFVYDDRFSEPLPTGVEPISHSYKDQKYWIADAMETLGYDDESYFACVRDYDNDLRARYGTDWAFTIFVVDSSADSDNRFSDGYFAYAYLGGPFFVMTYGNNDYGPDNMDAVAAHEMGHIFFALDQYASAGQSCTRRAGYLGVENQNSAYGDCASDVPSIMRGGVAPYRSGAIDEYAKGQIGWRDSDDDGVFDPLDVSLPITITTAISSNNVAVSGTTRILPYPSPGRASVTINTLIGVQYRLNGGDWQQAQATGGVFGGTSGDFHFALDSLPSGLYRLEVAAVDSAGNASDAYAVETLAIIDSIDGGLNTELYERDLDGYDVFDSETVTISGVAYHLEGEVISAVQYRVDGGSWQLVEAQDGAFDSDHEPFTLETGLLEVGTHLIEARAIDAVGNAEVNFARREVAVAGGVSTIFLPIVLGGA